MASEVIVLPEASDDLYHIYDFVAQHDGINRADDVYERLEAAIFGLDKFAKKGRIVPELERIDVLSYRQIVQKPYRVIYEVESNKVFVHAVLDSRRDLFDILQKRLLR